MNLRTTFIFFLLLFIAHQSSFAQSKKAAKYFTAQGGLLMDFHPNANYFGFNFGKVGWSKAQNGRESGLEFEGSYFNIRSDNYTTVYSPSQNIYVVTGGFYRKKHRIQASYYIGQHFVETKRISLLIAPIASLSFDRNRILPITSNYFSEQETNINIGLGIYSYLSISLSKKTAFVIGTKLFLLDAGYNIYKDDNPFSLGQEFKILTRSKPKIDFLRNEIPISLGFRFKLKTIKRPKEQKQRRGSKLRYKNHPKI